MRHGVRDEKHRDLFEECEMGSKVIQHGIMRNFYSTPRFAPLVRGR